jgi:hypothetical protein
MLRGAPIGFLQRERFEKAGSSNPAVLFFAPRVESTTSENGLMLAF